MLNIQPFNRKRFVVEAVQVTADNMDEVAKWCDGEVFVDNDEKRFIKVKVARAMTERQTKAFAGDWVLKAGNGFKSYTNKAFVNSFESTQGEQRDAATQAAKPQPPKPQAPVDNTVAGI